MDEETNFGVLESEEVLTKLQAFLRAQGLSHKDLAEAVGYKTQTISLAACGQRCGPALARAIALHFEDLITYEDIRDSQDYIWTVSRTISRPVALPAPAE